ncbi:hypothetical protein JGU66_29575 [Myxococcaceae bacterium JPH2]|nr:hypothetical protein [Myxococcaceae bacterium JPH2]
MLLELSDEDARELKQALDAALRVLLEEIAHAEQHAYRDMLRERYERLDQVNRRVAMATESAEIYA